MTTPTPDKQTPDTLADALRTIDRVAADLSESRFPTLRALGAELSEAHMRVAAVIRAAQDEDSAIRAVLDLHREAPRDPAWDVTGCLADGDDWPCSTVQAITAARAALAAHHAPEADRG